MTRTFDFRLLATKGSLRYIAVARDLREVYNFVICFPLFFLQSRFPFNRLPLTFNKTTYEKMQRPVWMSTDAFYLNCMSTSQNPPNCVQAKFSYFRGISFISIDKLYKITVLWVDFSEQRMNNRNQLQFSSGDEIGKRRDF
jgi:hypothetical protein